MGNYEHINPWVVVMVMMICIDKDFICTFPLLCLPISGTWENDICLGPDIYFKIRLNI